MFKGFRKATNTKGGTELINREIMEQEIALAVNYSSVLEYLVGLSDRDYEKIKEVTDINRESRAKTNKVLGLPNKALTSISADKKIESVSDDDYVDNILNDEPNQD